jgi:hypothetical protein
MEHDASAPIYVDIGRVEIFRALELRCGALSNVGSDTSDILTFRCRDVSLTAPEHRRDKLLTLAALCIAELIRGGV